MPDAWRKWRADIVQQIKDLRSQRAFLMKRLADEYLDGLHAPPDEDLLAKLLAAEYGFAAIWRNSDT